MESKVYRITELKLNADESAMLEDVLVEFIRARKGTEAEGDSYDKFADKFRRHLNAGILGGE